MEYLRTLLLKIFFVYKIRRLRIAWQYSKTCSCNAFKCVHFSAVQAFGGGSRSGSSWCCLTRPDSTSIQANISEISKRHFEMNSQTSSQPNSCPRVGIRPTRLVEIHWIFRQLRACDERGQSVFGPLRLLRCFDHDLTTRRDHVSPNNVS